MRIPNIIQTVTNCSFKIVFSLKKQSSTKGSRLVHITSFHDPDMCIQMAHPNDIINGNEIKPKSKKRKKNNLSKQRNVTRECLLKWTAKKKDGTEINFDDVLLHFVASQKELKSIDDIDASIYNEWNDVATMEAEEELQRQADVKAV